jgi:hypothetical protein
LANFPSEFLLFSPHVSPLVLLDLTKEEGRRRISSTRQDDGRVSLEADSERSEWRVYRRDHSPSKKARDDAGELADREILPVIWAVPLKRTRDRGQFWAFFPTEYQATTVGIINAPWKTNEDRQNLLTGDLTKSYSESLQTWCARTSRSPFTSR